MVLVLSFELQGGRGRAFGSFLTVTTVTGASPRYDAQGYGLSCTSAWLSRKLSKANPTSAAMRDEMCAKLVERRGLREGTATLGRQVLAAMATDAQPSLGRRVALTSTGGRTVRRWRQGEGMSYQSILFATQAKVAAELVNEETSAQPG